MRAILDSPSFYLLFQYLTGAMGARRHMLRDYTNLSENIRVLDIGCGPGYVVDYLPKCSYVGLDLDNAYISYANKKYGNERRTFLCQPLDMALVSRMDKFNLVLMNGLLHHLPNNDAIKLLQLGKQALKKEGMLLTMDGCYQPNQSRVAKWLLDMDRGKHVRNQAGYVALVRDVFSSVEVYIRSDIAIIPYTFIIMRCSHG
jgi:SAM-dependent methyltransferase